MNSSAVVNMTEQMAFAQQEAIGAQEKRECIGIHLLVELWSAPFPKLADAREIQKALGKAGAVNCSNGSKREITEVKVHQFNPYGVSGTASSPIAHILIHTWPENRYAAIDIFAHGRETAYLALERIKEALCPEYVHVLEMKRGQLAEMEET